jgi:diguanylate cyclase (GGDEF)-like protein/PAS domain S-box-containing protein
MTFRSPSLPRPEFLLAVFVVALGLSAVSGWLLHVPALFEIRAGLVPMVFNTGLCFLLSGSAIALLARTTPAAARVRRVLACLVMLLCGLTLAELILDRSLGIDMAGLHAWYDYGNTRPGRMAPNTATGFLLLASTVLLAGGVRSRRRAYGVVLLTFGVLAVGLTGLAGYLLAPDLLFGWAKSARMALHTATGMLLCALALWLTWSRSGWYQSRQYFREDGKIRLLGAAILLVVTTTAGLVGFVLLQTGVVRTLENNLEGVIRNRTPWFGAMSAEVMRRHADGVRLSGLDEAAAALLRAPQSIAERRHLDTLAARLLTRDVRGVTLVDARGAVVHGAGLRAPVSALTAPFAAAGDLLWDGEMILRTRVAVPGGALLVEQAAPALRRALFNASRLGATGSIALCAQAGDGVRCFPNGRQAVPYALARRGAGKPLPMELAVAGRGGVMHALDGHDVNVVAAYGALAPGLGIVAQQASVEVYTVIREALATGAAIIVVIALLGAAALYAQLHPLATRMWASERAASEKELEMRTLMEAAGDGILTTDAQGVIQSVNAAACRIFGYEAGALRGQPITALMPARERASQLRTMAQCLDERLTHLIGTPNIELTGQRRDGAAFPVELTINEAPLHDRRLFVGVVRDITERKAVELRLSNLAQFDTLTGLPNRALFMDRLSGALLRGGRTGGAVALMFLDLDGFKQVNDTLGHHAGDELLVQFAARLAGAVRKTDTVARLAGDEFTVVLEELADPDADARAVADKVVACARMPFKLGAHEAAVTVSVGLVLHYPQPGKADLADVLRRADAQMYAAKRAGKNAVCVA